MAYPQAYKPEQGYKYQILTKNAGDRSYEHCDYAKDYKELKYLLTEYNLAYGGSSILKSIKLPQKYWNMGVVK